MNGYDMVDQADEAGVKLRGAFEPAIAALSGAFTPLKDQLLFRHAEPGSGDTANSLSELARRLKVKMQG